MKVGLDLMQTLVRRGFQFIGYFSLKGFSFVSGTSIHSDLQFREGFCLRVIFGSEGVSIKMKSCRLLQTDRTKSAQFLHTLVSEEKQNLV